jgi:hypothetical protein
MGLKHLYDHSHAHSLQVSHRDVVVWGAGTARESTFTAPTWMRVAFGLGAPLLATFLAA